MSRRFAPLLLPLVIVAAGMTSGCDKNIARTLLAPSGQRPGRGVLSGRVELGAGGSGPALILIAPVLPGVGPSPFSSIQMMGDLTTPEWTFAVAPHFTQIANRVWLDTLSIPVGLMNWKFATNGDWNNNGADYASTLGAGEDGLENFLAVDNGGGRNLIATVTAAQAGVVLGLIDETDPARVSYKLRKLGGDAPGTFSDAASGAFSISGLRAGSYRMLVRAKVGGNTLERRISGITVGEDPVDIGVVSLATHTITATAGANGAITPSGAVAVFDGDSARFSIRANPGYRVADLRVDGASLGPDTTYTFADVRADHTLEASFEIQTVTRTIVASAGANGTITPSGNVVVVQGTNQHFSIRGNTGYQVESLVVDGVPLAADTTYTFTNVVANHTIHATFYEASGAIQGTLEFDPTAFGTDLDSAPFPPTTVTLYRGTTVIAMVTTTRADRSFSFTALAPGTYRVVADAHLFSATTRDPIVVGSTTVDIGATTLLFDFNELPSPINLLGSFNGWPTEPFPGATEMSQTALGVWELDQTITADTHYFKFVTDNSYDNPTDFGGDESITLIAPLTDAETALVSGSGTAIKAAFATAGTYHFTFDERRLTFTIQPVTAAVRVGSRR